MVYGYVCVFILPTPRIVFRASTYDIPLCGLNVAKNEACMRCIFFFHQPVFRKHQPQYYLQLAKARRIYIYVTIKEAKELKSSFLVFSVA